MSYLMWWSLVFRASMRWVIVSGWFGRLVVVVDGFSISRLRASSKNVWWCCCWGRLVGGGGDVISLVLGA